MYLAFVLLLGFGCVALFNFLFSIELIHAAFVKVILTFSKLF